MVRFFGFGSTRTWKIFRRELVASLVIVLFTVNAICQDKTNSVTGSEVKIQKGDKKKKKYKLPDIDLSHWSVTTPALNPKNGKAINILALNSAAMGHKSKRGQQKVSQQHLP